ncbi:hypothetical protein [Saccharothrix obliqua]|uniref:hypothetical protein n=1 Tax=Saccharothrix obliqua TaxID=2861747 RepID=UPI001C6061F0|nr:hypothetical protein [Saccharothrix obliqua]MBW4720207.1 hypothetical protein [Saccharothrix obliqua]
MRRLLAAVLLSLLALPATAHADNGPVGPTGPQTAAPLPVGLHNCGVLVQGRAGTGWCRGAGTFRVVVACADGRFARGPWLTIRGGQGLMGVWCDVRAVGAEIERSPHPVQG